MIRETTRASGNNNNLSARLRILSADFPIPTSSFLLLSRLDRVPGEGGKGDEDSDTPTEPVTDVTVLSFTKLFLSIFFFVVVVFVSSLSVPLIP